MLSPDDIRAACRKKHPAFLRALVTGEAFFPLEIRFGRPSTTAAWATLQSEISALALAQDDCGYRIDWAEINTRQWGRQRLPERVWFEHEAAFIRLLGKSAEVERFRRNVDLARNRCPGLDDWLGSHVARIIEHADDWPGLLEVCRYFLEHPRPGLYARELPVAVGTKFIEEHRPILRSLLDHLLPPEAVDTTTDHFESRYGLRHEEALVRLRLLDPELQGTLGVPLDDITTPLSRLRALGWTGLRVLIVENKMTFLTLPPLPGTVGLWGGGNAASLLASVEWLGRCRVIYWGDLDVHGFHILSRLRRAFPATESLMMNDATLDAHARYRVASPAATYDEIEHLSPAERHTYARLQAESILLEQEKIPHAHAVAALHEALGQTR
jgi:hypothetical protein